MVADVKVNGSRTGISFVQTKNHIGFIIIMIVVRSIIFMTFDIYMQWLKIYIFDRILYGLIIDFQRIYRNISEENDGVWSWCHSHKWLNIHIENWCKWHDK